MIDQLKEQVRILESEKEASIKEVIKEIEVPVIIYKPEKEEDQKQSKSQKI